MMNYSEPAQSGKRKDCKSGRALVISPSDANVSVHARKNYKHGLLLAEGADDVIPFKIIKILQILGSCG